MTGDDTARELELDDEDSAAVLDDGPTTQSGAAEAGRGPWRLLVHALLALSVSLLLVSAGAATWLYFGEYRHDHAVGEALATRVVAAATDGTVALLSYSPDTLDKDFATAKTHLTGDFLNYYTQFTAEIVTPAARQKSVKTAATVVKSAAIQLQPNTAEVLLFVNQTTTSKENPAGSFTASSVKVGLTKVGDDWLISAFDPV